MVSVNELDKVIPLILGGILFCFLTVWVIKQAAWIIKSRGYKLVYWRFTVPMFLSCVVPAGVLKLLRDDKVVFSLSRQKTIMTAPIVIVCVLCCIACLIKFKVKQGSAIFLIQCMCTLMLICFLYAAVALFLVAVVCMLGAEMALGDKYIQIIAIDLSETEYVIYSGSDMWLDREGNIYYKNGNDYLRRHGDMKLFRFMYHA